MFWHIFIRLIVKGSKLLTGPQNEHNITFCLLWLDIRIRWMHWQRIASFLVDLVYLIIQKLFQFPSFYLHHYHLYYYFCSVIIVLYLFKDKIGQVDKQTEKELEDIWGDLLYELLEGDQPMNKLNNEVAVMIGANRQPYTASVVTQANPAVTP